MAKENKNNTAKITFNDDRVLNNCEQFHIARERLIAWVDELGTKTLSVAFSGGREGIPFSALNLGILSTIGQGGIRERWLKACAEKGRDNVNIGDFILANMVQETEAEKKARIEREKALEAATSEAEIWLKMFRKYRKCDPQAEDINGDDDLSDLAKKVVPVLVADDIEKAKKAENAENA